jgi:hypothetical protein
VSAEFPLRPLTIGEILDAGVSVLRKRPLVLPIAAVLAGLEQAVLRPLRAHLGVERLTAHDLLQSFDAIWQTVSVGVATEAFILALLGGICGPAAARLLLTSTPGVAELRLRRRWIGVTLLGVIVGVGAAVTFFVSAVGWVFWFMLTGLVVPVLSIDGGVPASNGRRLLVLSAFKRALRFAGHGGLYAGRVRMLAYVPWLLVRLVLTFVGAGSMASLVGITSTTATTVIDYAFWIIVNAIMYATIACVDAATLLEARMRVEGLDIAVHHAARHSRPLATALAVPR